VNKTANCVFLQHIPTGISVKVLKSLCLAVLTLFKCHATRSLEQNRTKARSILISKLDQYYNQEQSKVQQKIDKIRKKKQKSRQRALKKYGDPKLKDSVSPKPNETSQNDSELS
jgi:protein subunit release factor B